MKIKQRREIEKVVRQRVNIHDTRKKLYQDNVLQKTNRRNKHRIKYQRKLDKQHLMKKATKYHGS